MGGRQTFEGEFWYITGSKNSMKIINDIYWMTSKWEMNEHMKDSIKWKRKKRHKNVSLQAQYNQSQSFNVIFSPKLLIIIKSREIYHSKISACKFKFNNSRDRERNKVFVRDYCVETAEESIYKGIENWILKKIPAPCSAEPAELVANFRIFSYSCIFVGV